MTDIIDRTRAALGEVGAFLPAPDPAATVEVQCEAARRLEAAGYPAMWLNETVGGRDTLVQMAVLLGVTDRMVVGTGVANIWARPAQVAHGAASYLAQAFPGRVVLGLGVGHRAQAEMVGRVYERPAATMRTYLEQMDGPTWEPPADAPYVRLVAANGPLLLGVAAAHADGAMPVMHSSEATAGARAVLGTDKLLVVFVPTEPGADPGKTAAEVQAQRAAGADHVVLTLPLGSPFGPGVDHLADLAPTVTTRG